MPVRKPLTTARATRSRFASPASVSGLSRCCGIAVPAPISCQPTRACLLVGAEVLDEIRQHLVGVDAVGLGEVVRQHAMAHDGQRERRDVLVRDVIAALHQRARLRRERDELRGADAGAVVHVLLHHLGRVRIVRPRGAHEIDGVAS